MAGMVRSYGVGAARCRPHPLCVALQLGDAELAEELELLRGLEAVGHAGAVGHPAGRDGRGTHALFAGGVGAQGDLRHVDHVGLEQVSAHVGEPLAGASVTLALDVELAAEPVPLALRYRVAMLCGLFIIVALLFIALLNM